MNRIAGGFLAAVALLLLTTGCTTLQDRWEIASSLDTIAAYDDFLKMHPQGEEADRAWARRRDLYEQRDWKQAEAADTVSAYRDYIRYYPLGRHKDEAAARLEALSLPPATAAPFVTNEAFLKRYQRGALQEEVSSTFQKRYYEQALKSNTLSAYDKYLIEFPSGVLAEDVRRRIEKLLFEEARAKDTPAAYEAYLNRYPEGVFASDARSRRETLSAPSLPPAWGTIMNPRPQTIIRAKRSTASKRKGRLEGNQPVRADFLRDGWYAVFSLNETQRDESKALGYVYAPLLAARKGEPPSAPALRAEGVALKRGPVKGSEEEGPLVEIKEIAFRSGVDGKELFFIQFDRHCTPSVAGIEGENMQITLEIKNASPLKEEWALIETGGKLIRKIRTSMDSAKQTALVVLDMASLKSYYVHQRYFEKEHIFSLEISEDQ